MTTKNPTVTIRSLVFGEGIPKICVSIVARTLPEVLESAKEIVACKPDMVEWRMDYLPDICEQWMAENTWQKGNTSSGCPITQIAQELRQILGDVPLLVTFRTQKEGGEQDLSPKAYIALYEQILKTGCADAIDVELQMGAEVGKWLISCAHHAGVKVIASNHDFQKTPDREILMNRLSQMEAFGADVAKIAVMPRSPGDLLTLLEVTDTAAHKYLNIPVITMSMGSLGLSSRLLGEVFGSCVTFASVGKRSAPGQIPMDELRSILETIHKYNNM